MGKGGKGAHDPYNYTGGGGTHQPQFHHEHDLDHYHPHRLQVRACMHFCLCVYVCMCRG